MDPQKSISLIIKSQKRNLTFRNPPMGERPISKASRRSLTSFLEVQADWFAVEALCVVWLRG